MHIAMTLPQARRFEAVIDYRVTALPRKAHALLEILLMNRGRWVEWPDLCLYLEMLPEDGWRAAIGALAGMLRREGLAIEHCRRTGLRLPLDVKRKHKLKVAA